MTPLRIVVLVVLTFGCSEPSLKASEPPARIERRTTSDDLATVTLSADAEAALGLTYGAPVATHGGDAARVSGEVMVANGRDIAIAAPIGGRIGGANVPRPGERVHPGQSLLVIVPLAAVDRDVRARAERDLAAAKADQTLMEQRVKRAEVMVADRSGSVRSLEEARAQSEVARATVEQSQSRLSTLSGGALDADVVLTIKSPSEGVLRSVRVTPGQSIPAGAVLLELVGAGRWIRATLSASDAVRFTAIEGATATRVGGGASVALTAVDGPPSADPLRGTVDRFFVMPNEADWVPGERVVVTLTGATRTSARLAVPRQAVVLDAAGSAWVYERVAEHRFRRRRVDVAGHEREQLLLAASLTDGVEIVTVGAAELWGFELGADR